MWAVYGPRLGRTKSISTCLSQTASRLLSSFAQVSVYERRGAFEAAYVPKPSTPSSARTEELMRRTPPGHLESRPHNAPARRGSRVANVAREHVTLDRLPQRLYNAPSTRTDLPSPSVRDQKDGRTSRSRRALVA